MPVFFVRFGQVSSYLDTDTMTVKNKTVEQIVHEEIMINMSKPNSFGFESKIIRQNQFTVSGNAGWKMEILMGPENDPFIVCISGSNRCQWKSLKLCLTKWWILFISPHNPFFDFFKADCFFITCDMPAANGVQYNES